MKKKIMQLAKGILDTEQPAIRILTPPVAETVLLGQSFAGSISLSSENGVPFRGLLYSDDDRLEILTASFGGVTAELEYRLHAEGLSEGLELDGHFTLVTNCGDFSLPYHFSICQPFLQQEEMPGSVKGLGELALSQPDMLLRLFESEQFLRLPLFKDDSLRALYEGLRRNADHRLALEEFLVACGAKSPVTITADETPQTYHFQGNSTPGELYLTRSGEGYLTVQITSEAPFLRLSKERWTGFDFHGTTCRVGFTIQKKDLHAGSNRGNIRVTTGRGSFLIPVTVLCDRDSSLEERRAKQYRRSNVQLCRSLVSLYGGQSNKRGMAAQVLKCLDACDAFRRPETAQKLIRAEILRQLGRTQEEKQILEELRAGVQRSKADAPVEYMWFLYLEEEIERGPQHVDSFLRLFYRMKESERNVQELFPLQIRADVEWSMDPDRILERIQTYIKQGPVNLLIRLELCRIYNEYPEKLKSLDPFTRCLLLFGARHEVWTRDMALKAGQLIAAEKRIHPSYFRILTLLYETYPEMELLQDILTMLIRSGCLDKRFNAWYRKGIDADVRIADLYEYYLCTLPDNFKGEIPQLVLLYFSISAPVKREARVNLYRYVLRNIQSDAKLYQLYEKQMRSFALEQLLAGQVSDDLGELYERMFIPEVLEPKTAQLLTDVLFTEHLVFANHNIDRVAILYGELKEEKIFPVVDGEAYVPIYTRNCRPLFIDRSGNRYGRTGIRRRRLMNAAPALIQACRELCPERLAFRLAECQELVSGIEQADAREALIRCLEWEELSPVFRRKLILNLIRHMDENDPAALPLLRSLKASPHLDARAGKLLTESFIRLEEDEPAIELIHRFGYRTFEPELLLRLISREIHRQNYGQVRELSAVALSLYRSGLWNSVTLTYLCRYYNGSTAEMRELLHRTIELQGLYYDLPERLLAQMLFTGELEELDWVAEEYEREGRSTDKLLLRAYTVVQCDRYFRSSVPTVHSVFHRVKLWTKQEKSLFSLPLICRIALLRWIAEKELPDEEELQLAEQLLSDLFEHGYLFGFEQRLARFLRLPAELADKTLIEYHGEEGQRIEIGMRLLPDEADEPMTYTELPHSYGGFFVKPVLLFTGETLEYELVSQVEGRRTVLLAGTRQQQPGDAERKNRFARLNQLIETAGDGSSAEWQEQMVDYGRTEVLLTEYFDCI